jgi:hypothetical protein
MKLVAAFLPVILAVNATGQNTSQNFYTRPIESQRLLAGLTAGLEVINNKHLNTWLNDYGVNTSSQLNYHFGVFALAGAGKYVIGFDTKAYRSKNPNWSNLSLSILLGRPFRWKKINMIPLLGVGGNEATLIFHGIIPPPLLQANPQGYKLYKNYFQVNPHVMVVKNFEGGPAKLAFEVGCNTYFGTGDWRFGGNGSNKNVSEVPNFSLFHPYFSIFIGAGRWY